MNKRNQNKETKKIFIDQTARFQQGDTAEISTDMGWVAATVLDIIQIDEGILYKVHYVPRWDTTGKGGFTVVTGAAIR